jgi:RNA polymerase sigma-70 factor, ECF subfamily
MLYRESPQKRIVPMLMVSSDTMAAPLSDRSLLRRLRGGCQDAATALYIRYAHRLRALVKAQCSTALARRVEPDDIVQSVFHRFFKRVCQGHYDVPDSEELWGLFLVMALNKIRSEETYHRADKRNLHLTQPIPHDLPDTARPRDAASYAVLSGTLSEVLDGLPAQQREMVELRIQGHGVDAIARQTGRAKRTVERNLQEIRRHLRVALGTDFDAPINGAPSR